MESLLSDDDDKNDEEDKINENQFIIDILKEVYANKDRNPEGILYRKKHSFKHIKDSQTRKELSSALMLMATLIATVTFAAAFTIPGGYKAEDPHKGMVVLGRNVAFRYFIISDAISMTLSVIAAVILIITPFQIDTELRDRSLGWSAILLACALMLMGLAFATGLYAVLSEQLPLAILVCCIGSSLVVVVYFYFGFVMVVAAKRVFQVKDLLALALWI